MTTTKRFQCKACKRRFATRDGAQAHIMSKHVHNGQTFRWLSRNDDGAIVAHVDSNADGQYENDPDERAAQKWYVFCDEHNMCIGVPRANQAEYMADHRESFCEVCTGASPYCVTCAIALAPWNVEEHLAHGTVLNAGA
jgi:hypothetical protein